MRPHPTPTLRNALITLGLATAPLCAQNTFFDAGDLVLFFQKPGNNNTVYVGLGSATNLYRGGASGPDAALQQLNFVNINTELTSAFGAGWASDPGIYSGLIACRTSSTGVTVTNGDPTRTLYTSKPREAVGTLGQPSSTAWDLSLTNPFTGGATQIISFGNTFETNYTTKVAVSPVSVSTIDDQNPFLSPGIQDTAFNAFGGGVQQAGSATAFGTMGAAGQVEFALDLYRILSRSTGTNSANIIAGPDKVGSYEGTVVVGSNGSVSFLTQGETPASTFTTWADSFSTQLPNADDRLPTADPDADGLPNLMEFVLNGNPAATDSGIAPELDATGSNFVFTFDRRDDSESPETTLVFQSSPDLNTWTDLTVSATSSGAVSVAENGTAADAITITISKGTNTKLFGRLKVLR